jgi:hypothetical protein
VFSGQKLQTHLAGPPFSMAHFISRKSTGAGASWVLDKSLPTPFANLNAEN